MVFAVSGLDHPEDDGRRMCKKVSMCQLELGEAPCVAALKWKVEFKKKEQVLCPARKL